MSNPIMENKTVLATGAWQKFVFLDEWNSAIIRARTAVAIQLKGDATAGAYLTVDSGSSWRSDAGNMAGTHIYVRAAADTVIEIAGQVII